MSEAQEQRANGISRSTFAGRIHRGWSVERAMTEKVNIKHRCRKGID